jgi:thiamine biosynthesis protein ThiS
MSSPETETIDIVLNGRPRAVARGSIAALLRELGVPVERVAVEMDRLIVRREDWDSTAVAPGAAIEIVHFVGGG